MSKFRLITSWVALRTLRGPSWDPLGPLLGASWPLLGALGGSWGDSWPSGTPPKTDKKRFFSRLGASGLLLTLSWPLSASVSHLLGSILVSFWPPRGLLDSVLVSPQPCQADSHPRSWQSCYTRFPGTSVGISIGLRALICLELGMPALGSDRLGSPWVRRSPRSGLQ